MAGAALAGRALLDVLRGRFDEAFDTVEEAERAQENAVGSMWTGPLAITRAELELWRGRPAEGRDAIAAMLRGASIRATRMPSTSPLCLLSGRGRPRTSLVGARATGDAAGEREAGALRDGSWRALGHLCPRRGVPGGAVPARGPCCTSPTAGAEHARALGDAA